MKIMNVLVEIAGKYEDDAGQYRGKVQLEGTLGKQELRLTASSISRIFAVIREEAVAVAKSQAKAVPGAVDEAIAGPLLAETSKIGSLEDEF